MSQVVRVSKPGSTVGALVTKITAMGTKVLGSIGGLRRKAFLTDEVELIFTEIDTGGNSKAKDFYKAYKTPFRYLERFGAYAAFNASFGYRRRVVSFSFSSFDSDFPYRH